jgi:hypothetical protein
VYVEALAKIPGNRSHEALLGLLESKEPTVRAMAAYGLGEHRSDDALEPLLVALDDKHWQVQSAALSAIPRLRDKVALRAAVPRLVDFLEWVTGRLRYDTAEALRKITGTSLGPDLKLWRDYLRGEKVPPADDDTSSADAAYVAPLHYYGLEVTSNRIALAIDTSLSMSEPIQLDRNRLRRESSKRRALAKGEAGGEGEDYLYDLPWWRIKTRLDLAREQAILLVSQLRDEQYFDVVVYSTVAHPWMGKLVPATSPNRQRAITMLRTLKPQGETNTWGALAHVFDLMGDSTRSSRNSPDELFLVTDGAPSAGEIIDQDSIVEATLHEWRRNRIRINSIGIGVRLKFLRRLSAGTGGQAKFFTK